MRVSDAETWLRTTVSNAPRPLPRGRFPRLLAHGESLGYSHETLLSVVDLWLNYGYCRIVEHLNHDIEILPEGHSYFYRAGV